MGRIVRFALTTVTAYLVIVGTLTLLFGNPVAERLLFGPDAGQSEKVISVWLEQEPLPAVTPFWSDVGEIGARGVAVQGLLLVWAAGLVLLYALGWSGRGGSRWWRGLGFGVVVWVVVFVFFEAWVPFNLLGEPFRLVVVELSLQLATMMLAGIAIAFVYRPADQGVPSRDA